MLVPSLLFVMLLAACGTTAGDLDGFDAGSRPWTEAGAPTVDGGDAPDDAGALATEDAGDVLDDDAGFVNEVDDDAGTDPTVDETTAIAPVRSGASTDTPSGSNERTMRNAATLLVATPSAPASPTRPPRWRLTWSDEFDGPQPGEDPRCYSRRAQCDKAMGWGLKDCDAAYDGALANLNKCTWSVYDSANWMDYGAPQADRLNAFHPSEVAVTGGALVLTAHRRTDTFTRDCGRPFDDPEIGGYGNWTKACPIRSGGLQSAPVGGNSDSEGVLTGFGQAYGRFEVKARLPFGPGSWPAHWLMPVQSPVGWPMDGEIDVLEAVAHDPWKALGTMHGADAVARKHISTGYSWEARTPYYASQRTFYDDFHVYSAEWDPWEVRFYVDKWLIGRTREGTEVKADDGSTWPMNVPDAPFHWILNSTIAPFTGYSASVRPDPATFAPQTHLIDWVRVYRTCETDADRCPWGGTFDGINCRVAGVPAGTRPSIEGTKVSYPAGPRGACPSGGTNDGSGRCVLFDFPPRTYPTLYANGIYTKSACDENTLSHQCRNPCGGVGWARGGACLVGAVEKSGFKGEVKDGHYYYFKKGLFNVTRASDCLPGNSFSRWRGCDFGVVPAGRTAQVTNGDTQVEFAVTALCNASEGLPNCANPCPRGGMWDGAGCFVRTAPNGTTGFLYGTGFYYQRLTTDPATACPGGGTYDGANCLLQPVPAGATAFLRNNALYLQGACANVSW